MFIQKNFKNYATIIFDEQKWKIMCIIKTKVNSFDIKRHLRIMQPKIDFKYYHTLTKSTTLEGERGK